MTTTVLGTSNVRGGPSRLTRTNPARATKGLGSTSLRQNSLVSNSGLPLALSSNGVASQSLSNNEPLGMYPAITHFSDAIAALPREYRRHTSLLKEVDAKAWGPEENLQLALDQCLADSATTTRDLPGAAQSLTSSTAADDSINQSEANSVAGASFDNASLASAHFSDPAVVQRRRKYHALRQSLMAVMVTMDEKNHVINNASEEMGKQIRRLDRIWPHIADEISEEARLGSLKHWAYTETNPTKKVPPPPTRRDAAATVAPTLHESEVAHRSHDRREAVRRQRAAAQHVESDLDDTRPPVRKTTTNGKKRAAEAAPDPAGLGISGAGAGITATKRKKPEKPATGSAAMERSISSALGGRPMSRESSQQDNSKKRKVSTTAMSVARKRINAATQDSPKLTSSPLAGTAGKEAYKRSPALSTVRPAMSRGRQNSTNTVESVKGGRPSSLASNRNGTSNNLTVNNTEVTNVASATGRAASEVKSNTREAKIDKAVPAIEDEPSTFNGAKVDHGLKGAPPVERSYSRQGTAKVEHREEVSAKAVASPRLPALQTSELKTDRTARGRASKTSTPVVGTFADAEAAETASANGSVSASTKPKRPPRNRVKDHGLHDSLSPKGLPMKRPHKKSGSLSFPSTTSNASTTQRVRDEAEPRTKSSTPSERDVLAANNNTIADLHVEMADDDEGEKDAPEEDEERYCYCQGVSYGEMVACDRDICPRQWFHLDCIGLKSVPKSAKWYCNECKEALAQGERMTTGNGKGKNGNGSVGGNGNGNGNGTGTGTGTGNGHGHGHGNGNGNGK
ncbi:hypothetical protein A1O7_09570 [Cladophialophora yegresii CBS 114405]|uniref:Chromatin modification-related protein n=1 Tax=Cladophialophora yegresii CBS 114405 TaxID=1182544 RepID=W9VFG6_9EURO|nr:uncharacterized protein A1O7_09570 [Cladophialophora yegresii CBS 114405]EXJ54233.1 hypothetical protein A1O7_09570 [Cladophialophora yegresii CBS 114405]